LLLRLRCLLHPHQGQGCQILQQKEIREAKCPTVSRTQRQGRPVQQRQVVKLNNPHDERLRKPNCPQDCQRLLVAMISASEPAVTPWHGRGLLLRQVLQKVSPAMDPYLWNGGVQWDLPTHFLTMRGGSRHRKPRVNPYKPPDLSVYGNRVPRQGSVESSGKPFFLETRELRRSRLSGASQETCEPGHTKTLSWTWWSQKSASTEN